MYFSYYSIQLEWDLFDNNVATSLHVASLLKKHQKRQGRFRTCVRVRYDMIQRSRSGETEILEWPWTNEWGIITRDSRNT